MPIEVELPDGAVVEFPDGTDNATMERALSQYAAPKFDNVQGGMTGSQQGGVEPSAGRSLGLGARDVLEGAGGLVGMIGGDAVNQYIVNPTTRALGIGEQTVPYRQAASNIADRLGLPKAQTPIERVTSDVGQALTGTALTLGVGGALQGARPVLNRLGNFLTAQPGLQAASTATGAGAAGATREAGGSEAQQIGAGLVGALAPGGLSSGSAATVRGLVRGADGAQMRQNIADFNRLGANPSVGQAAGRWGTQGLENLLAGGPTSSGVMTRFAERQADDIGSGLQRMANDMTPNASAERAGRAIERGTELFGRNANAMKRALYWQADQFIPGGTNVPLSNTWQAVDALTTPAKGATATTGALINPRIAQLRQTLADDLAAGGGQLPYSAIKQIRTNIGEAIADYSLSPDTPTRELKQLYAALSRDLESAARSQGPDALQAAKRANNYTRAVADRLEQVQRVIDRNGGPEKVFQAAMSGTRDGGTTLRSVMQSLPKEGQRAVTGAVIKRMGMPTPGQAGANAAEEFSASTFLTNWNRVSPEAKRALFDRHGPQFSNDVDRIARVAQNIKEGAQVFANPSGTANRAAALTYGGSLVGSLFTGGTPLLIGAGVGANMLARAMTNPAIVNRLAAVTVMPKGAIPAAINSMRQAAEQEGDEDMRIVADLLEQQYGEADNAAQQ